MMPTKTTVVNVRIEQYDVYIGRPGKGMDGYFGNPFKRNYIQSAGHTLDLYKDYFYKRLEEDDEFKKRIHQLVGKKLGCFCKPNPCHGDIICEYLNSLDK